MFWARRKKCFFFFRVLFCPSASYSGQCQRAHGRRGGVPEHATRASSSEDDVEHEVRFGSAFAALAVDDDASDDDTSDAPREPRRARASSTSSSSGSDDEGAPWFPPDATADEIVAAASAPGAGGAPAWAWSTGRAGASAPGATRRADEARRQKKPLLAKGEKRLLKKRHVAETRAARSAKRHGFTPADVKAALERLSGRLNTHTVPNADLAPEDASPASSSRDYKTTATANAWRPPNGGVCGAKEARTIAALARCFPGLRVTAVPSRSNKNRVEVVVDLVDSPESPESPESPASKSGRRARGARRRARLRDRRAGAHSRGVSERPDAPREAGESHGRSACGNRAGPATRAADDARGSPRAGAYNAPKDEPSRGGRRDATATRRDATISTTPHPFASGGTLQEQDGFFEYADAMSPRTASVSEPGFRTRTRRAARAMKVLSATSRDTRPVSAARVLARAGFSPGEGLGEGRAGHSRARAGARQAEKAGAGGGRGDRGRVTLNPKRAEHERTRP